MNQPAENEPCFSANAISHVISSVKNFYLAEMKVIGIFIYPRIEKIFPFFLILRISNC